MRGEGFARKTRGVMYLNLGKPSRDRSRCKRKNAKHRQKNKRRRARLTRP